MESTEAPQATPEESTPRKKKQIKWDEATIAEHDKERGTRMKIDEPDTPFLRLEDDGGELTSGAEELTSGAEEAETAGETAMDTSEEIKTSAFAVDLTSKLETLSVQKDAENRVAMAPVWETADEEEDRKRRFKAKRNAHYNEMEMLRKWKADHAEDEMDQDDGELVEGNTSSQRQ